ncbi:hypothetical protein C7477_1122 [Phyllobacterium leguminum]|uniref:Uncharacterized protein n=1 Tax=Phyllobacterium leguminum TaxID=314237 RepID=A0A318T3T0_9HYPH|nr:hypothetical protein C7477_1122 [Phyllobacterium leguminum]
MDMDEFLFWFNETVEFEEAKAAAIRKAQEK